MYLCDLRPTGWTQYRCLLFLCGSWLIGWLADRCALFITDSQDSIDDIKKATKIELRRSKAELAEHAAAQAGAFLVLFVSVALLEACATARDCDGERAIVSSLLYLAWADQSLVLVVRALILILPSVCSCGNVTSGPARGAFGAVHAARRRRETRGE